jgi:hypothetical protein
MRDPQNTIFNSYFLIIFFPQIILINISNYSNIVTSAVRHTDKMAENRSKSKEAAALLRRAPSILTQNSAESEGCSSESARNSNMGNTVRPIQPAPSQQATTSSHDEFRQLFALYNRSLVHQPPAKRGRGNSWGQTRSFK